MDSNTPSNSVKYHWALNDKGETVSIKDINEQNRGEKYFCPNCGCSMIPSSISKENKRQPHFKHKGGEHCTYESYLHVLSKKLLKEEFDRRRSFVIEVDAVNCCDQYHRCLLRQNEDDSLSYIRGDFKGVQCESHYKMQIDLKQFYNQSKIEGEYMGVVADVKLYDADGRNPIPLFLEILHTHKCTQPKIELGVPIIEFLIRDEDDLSLLKDNVIREVTMKVPKRKPINRVVFYNINAFEDSKPYERNIEKKEIDANEYYFDQRNVLVCRTKKLLCHSLYTGEGVSSDAIGVVKSTNSKMVETLLTKAYVERSFLYLNDALPGCCEQCKYVKRNTRGHGWLEKEYYSCTQNVDIENYRQMNHLSIMQVWCGKYEQDEKRLRCRIEMAGCVGWTRKKPE